MLILLVFSSFSFSQSYYSDFEDGTLQGWTNTDNSTTLLTVDGVSPNLFLQKECDGSNSPVGEMAIINTSDWAGSFPLGPFTTLWGFDLYMKNDNNFDLNIRFGFIGGDDNTKIITPESFLISAFSEWMYVFIDVSSLDFTVIEGENTIEEIFEDIHEVKIFHNDAISYNGIYTEGILKIDNIGATFLLSNEDEDLSKAKLYPNPVNTIVNLKLPFATNGSITFYNVLGGKVLSTTFSSAATQIDVSELKSGIYLARIQTEKGTIIKKIVKL